MNVSLRTYSGKQLEVLGSLRVNVKYETQVVDCEVLVVKGAGSSLLGRDCLRKFKLDWKKLVVNVAKSNHNSCEMLRSFKKKESVSVRNYQFGHKWRNGRVCKVVGTRTCLVKLNIGKVVKRHINQMRYRVTEDADTSAELEIPSERIASKTSKPMDIVSDQDPQGRSRSQDRIPQFRIGGEKQISEYPSSFGLFTFDFIK